MKISKRVLRMVARDGNIIRGGNIIRAIEIRLKI